MAPTPLSIWYPASPGGAPQVGLLLGVATAMEDELPAACKRLSWLIRRYSFSQ
jgi:GntR family transcriptional regulator/MocR family aminotransferase